MLMKKIIISLVALLLSAALAVTLTGCKPEKNGKTFTIGLCNYVDDASLNQIYMSIQSELESIGATKNVIFEVYYDNCNADPNVLSQIITNFTTKRVDLLVGIATPVALQMQAQCEDSDIPIVFSAVSDPVGVGLVSSLDAPGANITGTSDYLDTAALIDLIFLADPSVKKVGLLYDIGQDSSTKAIAEAKQILTEKGIDISERTGTNTDEIVLAAKALIADGVDAIFTPTDNTVMNAELAFSEELAAAGIPQFCGADAFALNGAFLGYGVDYELLGKETANIVADILINGKAAKDIPVITLDNGTATVNTDTCAALGYDYDALAEKLAPHCTAVRQIKTAENF